MSNKTKASTQARKQSPTSGRSFSWPLPEVEEIGAAITYFHALPIDRPRDTMPFSLYELTGRKRQRLVSVFECKEKLQQHILDQYQELPDKVRTDGVLDLILGMREGERFKSRNLANTIRKAYPQEKDSPVLSRTYESICRDTASRLVGWAGRKIRAAEAAAMQNQTAQLGRMPQSKGVKPSLADVYRVWREQDAAYEKAAHCIIPFGRNSGATLAEHGKREAYWLLEHLLSEEEIKKLLKDVDTLLDDDQRVIEGDAMFTEHPWMLLNPGDIKPRLQKRAVRERQLMQRVINMDGNIPLLGILDNGQLEALGKELREIQNIATLQTVAAHIQPALAETLTASKELEDFRRALEVFIQGKPELYPSATIFERTEEYKEELQTVYDDEISLFSLHKSKPVPAKRFLDEHREKEISEKVLQLASTLCTTSKRQSLSMVGTARPGYFRDFALLYDKANYRCVLALMLHKHGTFTQQEQKELGHREDQKQAYKERHARNPLFYVNFPLIPFTPPQNCSVLLVPLQYGADYQRKRIKEVIQHQQQEQSAIIGEQRLPKKLTRQATKELLPDAICTSAKLLYEPAASEEQEFTLHVTFSLPEPPKQSPPSRVVAIHERDGKFYYAVLELDGTVQEVAQLPIPRHVDPEYGAKENSDNYVYALANAILAIASKWQAYIGIEDTLWKKARSVSRSRNRRVFRVPMKRIIKTLQDKAHHSGMLKPAEIRNISPMRDCAYCKKRLAKRESAHERQAIVCCPTCTEWHRYDEKDEELQCIRCGRCWKPETDQVHWEFFFVCGGCNAGAKLAWQNTAIVVAQRTLVDLRDYYKHVLAAGARREKKELQVGVGAKSD